MAGLLVNASDQLSRSLRNLRNLNNAQAILISRNTVYRLQDEGDGMLSLALGRLFNEANPIRARKWREIFWYLGIAATDCKSAADIVVGAVGDALG